MNKLATKLRDHPWRQRYATSQLRIGGPPVNILHDFYIPALERSKHYDRIAGYFSSTSLAAASQGFSRFVGNGGQARFIVGTQLNFDDVRTIIEVSAQRVERNLLQRLAHEDSWPESVKDGVALLAWMLRNGHLDIRVGIRKHQDDATLQPLDYAGDGYMHEKWAIFSDGVDELLVSGSLNESVTALSINAENLTLQPSWIKWNQEVIHDCHRSFEALWKNEHPAFEVYALPEAVRKRLVKFADRTGGYREIDGTPANLPAHSPKRPQKPETTPTVPFSEQVAFALIRLAPLMPGGQYVGMETAPVTPWPHQRFVARRLIDTFPCNHLLCDEVGLGKTIEAGLAFRSLWLTGMADSIRIFCPASLTSQWMHEMAEKFLLPFRRRTRRKGHAEVADPISGEVDQFEGSMFDFPLEIISTGLIIHKGSEPLLESMPKTDLVILDEAHKARRAAPDRLDREASYNHLYRGLKQALYPRSRCLLLATATPMQLNKVEAFDLLKTMPSAGAVQFSEDLCAIFYQIRSKLLDSIPLERYEGEWLRRYLADTERSSPVQWEFVLEHVLEPSDKFALEYFVKHDLEPQVWSSLQPALSMLSPLGRSMLRHNRQLLRQYQNAGLLKENLAFRDVLPKLIVLRGVEREIYDELQDYCGELSQQIGAHQDDSQARAAIGFYLSFLRLRFASSFPALRLSLKRRLEKIDRTLRKLDDVIVWPGEEAAEELSEDDAVELVLKNRTHADLNWESGAVEALLKKMEQLPATPQKTSYLLEAIQNRRIGHTDRVRQMVVFTRYADTLKHLHEVIGARLPGCPIGTFSGAGGSLRRANARDTERLDRTTVRKRFMQGEIDILLCTDAAAEGLNLQSADLLVNFDLPWNPMLLEQRIGRIDRIGQHHERISVHNYLYQGSVEEVVYLRLVDRFRSAMEVAGELQFSLLPVQEEDFQDFAKSTREPGRITEDGLIERAHKHAKRIVERQKLMEFDARRQREVYESIERLHQLEKSPVTLEGIWTSIASSVFLQNIGCSIEFFDGNQAMRLKGLEGIEDGTLITASRELYERGLPANDRRTLHFASYGDSVFERLLENLLKGQTDVAAAWTTRGRIRALAVGGKEVSSLTEVANIDGNDENSIRVISAPETPPAAQTDKMGKVQKRVLMDGVAGIAEQKLSSTPETPAVQLARIDSLQRDLGYRSHQSCLISLQPRNAPEISALSRRLLWPVQESTSQLQLKVDPLFLQAARSIIERALQKLERQRRTGGHVAARLREIE